MYPLPAGGVVLTLKHADKHAGGHHVEEDGEDAFELVYGKAVGEFGAQGGGEHAEADDAEKGREVM